MVIYVALIAILNLGLGYALAVYLGKGSAQLVSNLDEPFESLDHSDLAASE